MAPAQTVSSAKPAGLSAVDGSPAPAAISGIPSAVGAAASTGTSAAMLPESSQAPAKSPAAEEASEISQLVNAADVLLIKVLGSSITGEYRVNADDTISIPVIGRLSVANISIAKFERELAARVLKQTGKEAYATVEVVKYKPVFVSGQVATAGAHSWSPGMTVLHAETLSGGVYRPLRQATASGLAASQTLKDRATSDLKSALASRARLVAEFKGSEVVDVPEQLEWLVGRTEAKQIIASQQRLFESRAAARNAQLTTLRQSLSVAESEYSGLQQQAGQINTQLHIRESFHVKLMRLKNAGLIPEERALEQQARISELQERKTNLTVGLSRAQGTILNVKQEIIKLMEVRKAEIETEILNLEREIQKATIDLETARNAERLLARENLDADPTTNVEKKKIYTIVRREGIATKQFEAEQFTLVRPGDIVIVDIK